MVHNCRHPNYKISITRRGDRVTHPILWHIKNNAKLRPLEFNHTVAFKYNMEQKNIGTQLLIPIVWLGTLLPILTHSKTKKPLERRRKTEASLLVTIPLLEFYCTAAFKYRMWGKHKGKRQVMLVLGSSCRHGASVSTRASGMTYYCIHSEYNISVVWMDQRKRHYVQEYPPRWLGTAPGELVCCETSVSQKAAADFSARHEK